MAIISVNKLNNIFGGLDYKLVELDTSACSNTSSTSRSKEKTNASSGSELPVNNQLIFFASSEEEEQTSDRVLYSSTTKNQNNLHFTSFSFLNNGVSVIYGNNIGAIAVKSNESTGDGEPGVEADAEQEEEQEKNKFTSLRYNLFLNSKISVIPNVLQYQSIDTFLLDKNNINTYEHNVGAMGHYINDKINIYSSSDLNIEHVVQLDNLIITANELSELVPQSIKTKIVDDGGLSNIKYKYYYDVDVIKQPNLTTSDLLGPNGKDNSNIIMLDDKYMLFNNTGIIKNIKYNSANLINTNILHQDASLTTIKNNLINYSNGSIFGDTLMLKNFYSGKYTSEISREFNYSSPLLYNTRRVVGVGVTGSKPFIKFVDNNFFEIYSLTENKSNLFKDGVLSFSNNTSFESKEVTGNNKVSLNNNLLHNLVFQKIETIALLNKFLINTTHKSNLFSIRISNFNSLINNIDYSELKNTYKQMISYDSVEPAQQEGEGDLSEVEVAEAEVEAEKINTKEEFVKNIKNIITENINTIVQQITPAHSQLFDIKFN